RCRQFWPSPPAPSCAACADTKRSPNGPTISPPRRANASAADAAAANTWCPANSPSAIFSSASTRPSSTGLCKGGTRLTPRKMKAWPSMARPCATPSTTRAVKQTNEIATAIPLLDAIDIKHKEITADALLTQRKLAEYLVVERSAHYYFTV